jgi:hypothetical protein
MKGIHYVVIGFTAVVAAKLVKNLLAGYGITF